MLLLSKVGSNDKEVKFMSLCPRRGEFFLLNQGTTMAPYVALVEFTRISPPSTAEKPAENSDEFTRDDLSA